MNRTIVALLISLSALSIGDTTAAAPHSACDEAFPVRELRVTIVELRSMLRQRDFGGLDVDLARRLRQYRDGEISDDELLFVFQAFYLTDPAATPLLQEWRTQSPQSYPAQVAMGFHLISQAFAQRGRKWANETSKQQMDEFDRTMNRARQQFEESLERYDRPVLSYWGLIQISRTNGPWAQSRELLDRARRIDPTNLIARRAAVRALAPKWHGSLAALDRFADDQLSGGLTQDGWRNIRSDALIEMGDHYVDTKEHDSAIRLFLEAQPLCARSDAIRKAGHSYSELKKYAEAIAQYDRVVKGNPNDSDALQRRASNFEKLGQ